MKYRGGDISLFVVVGLAFDDGAGAVNLFGEDEADHLVGEGEAGEGELLVGSGIDGRGETVRASDDEDEATGGVALLFEPAGQFDTTVFVPMLVEQYDGVRGLQLFEDEFTLSGLLLFFREILSVLEFGDGDELEGHIVADALNVVVDACLEMLVGGFPHENEKGLH